MCSFSVHLGHAGGENGFVGFLYFENLMSNMTLFKHRNLHGVCLMKIEHCSLKLSEEIVPDRARLKKKLRLLKLDQNVTFFKHGNLHGVCLMKIEHCSLKLSEEIVPDRARLKRN